MERTAPQQPPSCGLTPKYSVVRNPPFTLRVSKRLFVELNVRSRAKVWVYRAGFCRFSHARYSNATEDLEDMEKHLTNVAIQVHGGKKRLENCLLSNQQVAVKTSVALRRSRVLTLSSIRFNNPPYTARSSAETHGELRQGVRWQVGDPTAQAAPDGVARRLRGEYPLPRDTVPYTAEPSICAAGACVVFGRRGGTKMGDVHKILWCRFKYYHSPLDQSPTGFAIALLLLMGGKP